MSDNITSIKDPTVYWKSGEKLVQYLEDNLERINKCEDQVPDNIRKVIENKGGLIKNSDIEWLNEFLKKERDEDENDLLKGQELYDEVDKIVESKYENLDLKGILREKNKKLPYLHELMKGSELVLPKNEVIPRNPVLAERIERLKKEQEDREYKAMTQNVDPTKKFIAEDSISYQINMMNRHLIAVGQFLLSVGAGFAFGFLGINLILGDLNFGVRLLLGITCALVIGIAEFYFLAKHLNEEDKDSSKEMPTSSPSSPSPSSSSKAKTKSKTKTKTKTKVKLHKD